MILLWLYASSYWFRLLTLKTEICAINTENEFGYCTKGVD